MSELATTNTTNYFGAYKNNSLLLRIPHMGVVKRNITNADTITCTCNETGSTT